MSVSSDDLIELFDAALAADYTRLRRIGSRIAKALGDEDTDTAKRLRTLLRRRGVPLRASGYAEALPVDAKSRLPLIEEQPWPTTPMFLDETGRNVLTSFLSDVEHLELLSAKGLATRLCMLLAGPPGTGKSLLAGHIAAQLNRPLYVVRLDSVISSLLGDTAKNIRSVFDFVAMREGVLFLDEMDAVAKLRDDQHELGELKRVVNTVIQGLDALDDRAVVVAATNHPQLLDPAIWRRFPYKLDLGTPDTAVREDLWRHFLTNDDETSPIPSLLARISEGLSGADIRNLALASRRHAVLAEQPVDTGSVTWAALQKDKGRLTLPERNGLSSGRKKAIAQSLAKDFNISQADVARLLNVSRQAVSGYLKDDQHGDG